MPLYKTPFMQNPLRKGCGEIRQKFASKLSETVSSKLSLSKQSSTIPHTCTFG